MNRPDVAAFAAAAVVVVDHPDMIVVPLEIDWIQMNRFHRNCYWPLQLVVVDAVDVELMMSMMR